MKSVIVFVGSYKHHIPFVLGFFGKENLEYKSEFNPNIFDKSETQIYYHPKLNCDILVYANNSYFLEESNEVFDEYNAKIFCMDLIDGKELLIDKKLSKIPNSKKIFIWFYGEVFDYSFLKSFEKIKYDKILLGGNRKEVQCEIDYLLPFRYFRYYIGYYWIEELMNNFIYPKYNKNSPRLFSYSRAYNSSSWRSQYILELGENLTPKNSANDAYDLTYPKYKHFETIFDYTNCNVNLIFETINCANEDEAFLTEKTYKGLFFGKPFYLLAPVNIISYLKSKGFYLLNFEFGSNFDSIVDLNHNFNNFKNWIKITTEEEFEKMYNIWLEKAQKNRKMLFHHLNDYSQSEEMIKKLLN